MHHRKNPIGNACTSPTDRPKLVCACARGRVKNRIVGGNSSSSSSIIISWFESIVVHSSLSRCRDRCRRSQHKLFMHVNNYHVIVTIFHIACDPLPRYTIIRRTRTTHSACCLCHENIIITFGLCYSQCQSDVHVSHSLSASRAAASFSLEMPLYNAQVHWERERYSFNYNEQNDSSSSTQSIVCVCEHMSGAQNTKLSFVTHKMEIVFGKIS